MTRTLILMRHAKSSWDHPALADHDRPLNKRGKRAAARLGKWLAAWPWQPDQALVSSSVRTRQTLAGLGLSVPADVTGALYHAQPAEMRRVLETAHGATVLMIGHNPGISAFARELVSHPPKHPRFRDFPTGATVIMQFDIESWSRAEPGTGQVRDFVIPRELPE